MSFWFVWDVTNFYRVKVKPRSMVRTMTFYKKTKEKQR